ncbi:MAG: Rpn family recombination-promoting nuclease/putative transposase [Cyclobacteriaceae bacterium]
MNNEEKYINPFTDFGFKKLFGTEFNKELLIDFLNQVLGDREQVQDLTYLNSENLGNTQTDRKAIFDLYCENEQGEKFIIELQNVKQQYFKDRSIFYSTFPIQSQAPKGKEWDYYLKAVYTIGILNFSFPDQIDYERFMREVQLIDRETAEVFYDKLTFIYLEMPKFKKTEDELVSHFDKWLYVLKNLHRLQDRPVKLQEKVFEKLFSEAEIAKLNKEEMRAYEESLKVYRDNKNSMDYAIETARKDRDIEIAKAMKKYGDPVDKIAAITGLTKEEIEKL